MIHLIICGHGEFAEGLLSGAKLLCGDKPSCDAINFSEGKTPETLREELQASINSADGQPVLFLTDILGGTPFRECSALAAGLADAEVMSGANLQIVIEAIIEREDGQADLKTFARDLISSAQECMTLLSDKLASQQANQNNTSSDEGI